MDSESARHRQPVLPRIGNCYRAAGAADDMAELVDPESVLRWFDDPKTAEEKRIRSLIEESRNAETTKLEQEIFAQKKRLPDAQRKLEVKVTKAATESKRIAGEKIERALSRLERLNEPKARALDEE